MNLSRMTLQQIFNMSAVHLLTQGKRSIASNQGHSEQCAYRGENGLKCAVGIFITDEEYRPRFEGMGVCDYIIQSVLGLSMDIYERKIELLRRMQDIHDNVDPSEWREKIVTFAASYADLSTEALPS